MKKITNFIFLTVVIIVACSKSKPVGDNEYVTLSYKQTSCSDPWRTASNDSLTAVNVSAYLNSSNLYHAGVFIKTDGLEQNCAACMCKTGKTIYVSTLKSATLIEQYNQKGFK